MERFSILRDFVDLRYSIQLDQQNGGSDLAPNNIAAFNALSRLLEKEKSHYTKRLFERARSNEAHWLSEHWDGAQFVDVDEANSDPEPLKRYLAYNSEAMVARRG